MNHAVRMWLTRFLVATIVVSAGLNGYLAHAAHGDHVAVAHVLGTESGKHHHHPNAQTFSTYVLFCHVDTSCHEDPGNATDHVHVSCYGPVAVIPGDVPMASVVASAAIGVDRDSLSRLGQVLYPPFKPPRAAV
jgi:hypothetical protein